MEARVAKNEIEISELKSLLITHIENEPKQLDAIRETIEKSVNGKIDKIHTILEKQNETMQEFIAKVDKHIAKVEPYIEAYEGVRSA